MAGLWISDEPASHLNDRHSFSYLPWLSSRVMAATAWWYSCSVCRGSGRRQQSPGAAPGLDSHHQRLSALVMNADDDSKVGAEAQLS